MLSIPSNTGSHSAPARAAPCTHARTHARTTTHASAQHSPQPVQTYATSRADCPQPVHACACRMSPQYRPYLVMIIIQRRPSIGPRRTRARHAPARSGSFGPPHLGPVAGAACGGRGHSAAGRAGDGEGSGGVAAAAVSRIISGGPYSDRIALGDRIADHISKIELRKPRGCGPRRRPPRAGPPAAQPRVTRLSAAPRRAQEHAQRIPRRAGGVADAEPSTGDTALPCSPVPASLPE